MNTSWLRVTLVCGLVLFLWFGGHRQSLNESFVDASNRVFSRVNEGDKPWQRHPIETESVPVNTPIKYQKAYYYEMDNVEYDKALQYTFAHNCDAAKEVFAENVWENMTIDADGGIIERLHGWIIEYLKKTLNESKYLRLKNKTPSLIQVVHDVYLGSKRHKSKAGQYVYQMEAILYREYAPHGKHVSLDVFIDASQHNKVQVVVVRQNILGIVTSQSIGLHPMLPTDPQELEQNELPFDPNPLVPFPSTLLDETTIQVVMRKQQERQEADRKAAEAVGRNRYENTI